MKIEAGKGLVIRGGKGSGKTTLARKIASDYGEFTEVLATEIFDTKFGLGYCIKPGVQTVIIDDFSIRPSWVAKAKMLVSEPEIMVERKWNTPKLEKMPNFIFCTEAVDVAPIQNSGGRFMVINL